METFDKKFVDYINSISNSNQNIENKSVQIMVYCSPWYNGCVTHFSIILAKMFVAYGYEVFVLFDDLLEYNGGNCENERKRLLEILKMINTDSFKIHFLSQYKDEIYFDEFDIKMVEIYAKERTVYDLRSSVMFEPNGEIYKNYYHDTEKACLPIKSILKTFSGIVVVPGGVCGHSNFFYKYMGAFKTFRVVSFDLAPYADERIIIGTHSVAAYCWSVDETVKRLEKEKKDKWKDYIIDHAKKEFSNRYAGNSVISNYKPTDSKYFSDVLIPLNIEWDSSVIGNNLVFEDIASWLEETLDYLLQKDVYIIVRQHPHERYYPWKDVIKEWFRERYNSDRIWFVSCDERINTYQLIESTKIVLPFSSTVGIEAAILGKPVILHAKALYANTQFSTSCESKKEYFDVIDAFLHGNYTRPIDLEQAYLYYGVSQLYLDYEIKNFSPLKKYLEQFITTDWNTYTNEKKVHDLISCIENDIPIPYCNIQRIMENQHESLR